MPMDSMFEQILKFLTGVGIVDGTIVIAVILVFMLFYRYANQKIIILKEGKDRTINDLHTKLYEQERRHSEDSIKQLPHSETSNMVFGLNDLKKHPIFSNIAYWIAVQIPRVHFRSDLKRCLFKDYMVVMNATNVTLWKEYLDTHNIESINTETLCDEIIQLMTNITNTFTSKLIHECNMPQHIVTILNDSHHLSELFMFAMWNSICRSPVFDDNFDKVYTLLNIRMQINEVLLHEVASKLSEEELTEDFEYTPKT